MSSQQILPVNDNVNSSGQGQKSNGIVQIQQPQNSPNSAWVLVDNGMVYINGQVQITPEQIATKISSPNQTSQIECNQNGIATITGDLDMQNNQIINLPDPTQSQQPVTLNYLEQNYQDSSQTQQSIAIAISGLSSVYMPLNQPLDQINPPQNSLDLNYQRIVNLADPQQQNDAVNLEFLQTNYTNTTNSQQYVNQQIADLSMVYMPIDQTLNNIPLATNNVDLNNNKITNLAPPTQNLDGVNLGYLQTNYTNTTNSQQYVNQQIADLSMVYMPIDQTLNNIDLPTDNLDMNNQQIKNMLAGTDPNDAVIFSQLDGLLPIDTNINGLQPQTNNYDTNGYQITVSQAPQQNEDLTNKQYVDGQISSIQNNYVSNNSLAMTLQGYYTGSYIDQTFQTISDMVNYLTISSAQSTYQTISDMVNYLTISSAQSTYQTISDMSNYVTNSFLTANYLTSNAIQQTYQTISDMSNYVTNSFLTANYITSSAISQTYQTIADMTNYVTNSVAQSTYQTLLGMADYVSYVQLPSVLSPYLLITTAQNTYQTIADMVNYVTNSSLATTLSSYITSTQLSLSLQPYLTQFNASQIYQPLASAINTSNVATYTTEIKSTSAVKSKVSCASNSEILFDVNDVQKMRIYTPQGQTPNQPTGIEVAQKLQFVTGENSVSISGSKELVSGQQNGTGLYIKTPYSTTNDLFTQVCVQPNSSNCQNLTMSSGQVNLPGLGMTQYSTLCNGAGGVQQNLQISASLPNLGDQTLNFYSNQYASLLGQELTAQFTNKTGYSTAVDITESNQFTSKTYVDSLISGLSSVYQTISGFNSAISNYYNKIQSDARYYLNTTTLNNITQANGNLLIGDGTTNYQIKNVLDPTSAQDVATKYYVDTQAASGISLATGKQNFYTLDATNTVLPSATLNMNNQLISNVQDPVNQQDAMNLQTANANYVLQTTVLNDLTPPSGSLSLNNQKITGLANGTNNFDAVNFSQLTTTNTNVTTVQTNLTTFQNKFMVGRVDCGTATTSTSNQSVLSFSGPITSAFKKLALSGTSLFNQTVTINYSFSQTPYIMAIARMPQTAASPSQAYYGFTTNIQTISQNQATFLIGNPLLTQSNYTSNYLIDFVFILL